jgi:agmatinase
MQGFDRMLVEIEHTFAGLPGCTDLRDLDADIAILGIPFGVPYVAGTSSHSCNAPAAIRRESVRYSEDRIAWDFDLGGTLLGDDTVRVVDCGDLRGDPQDGIGNQERIQHAIGLILEAGATPVILGGDDSVPIPVLRAHETQPPFTVVQLDAHIDWRDQVSGVRDGYSSTMRRAAEVPSVEKIVQVGMRGVGSARTEEYQAAQANGAQIITAYQLMKRGSACVMEHIPTGSRCYLTLDFDVLDPSEMPAVGAPTPGGLRYAEVIELIHQLARSTDLIGANLVELVPEQDVHHLGAITAMRVVWNVIGSLVRAHSAARTD